MGKNFTKVLTGSLAALSLVTVTSVQAEIKFNAVASFPTANAGVYSFTTGEYNPVLIKRNVFASGGGIAYDDGYYYGTRFETIMGLTAIQQCSYDMNGDWAVEDEFSGSIDKIATASTFDADLGLAFGCFLNADGETYRLCSINVPYYGYTKIADLPKAWGACGFNKDGILYALDEDGDLFTVNTDFGTLTEVGKTGLHSEWITGGMVDKESNTMIYATKTDTDAALYSIDLATAKATKLYDLENQEQLGGFFVPYPTYAGNVPANSTSSPSLSVSGTNLNGNFAFYPPYYSVDGTTGQGDLTYHVYLNGKEFATGETAYKKGRIQVPFTVEKSGYYSFAVSFSNEAGEGPRKRADVKYIGVDIPKATNMVSVSNYDKGAVTVRWSGVSSGIHNGSIDRNNLVYKVTRYPDGVVVSDDGLKTTSLTDQLPETDNRIEYWYTVEAITGDLKSPATSSAKFAVGPITPPYNNEFQAATDFFGYSTLNPGADTKTWSYDSDKCIKVSTSSKPADNWLLLPAVNVKAGLSYEFTIMARSYGSSYTETFEVKAGDQPSVEALTESVIASSSVNGNTYKEFTGSFTPAKDGKYYIGVHATTATNGGYLYINNIKIGSGKSDLAPAAITDLVATADATGAHKATFTFTVPSKNVAGTDAGEVTKIEIYRDDELIKTVTEGIETGKTISIVDDTDPSAGSHVYVIKCYNSYGDGPETKTTVFIGFAAPNNVAQVTMTEPRDGHVVATWTPVTTDVNGTALSEDNVTYNVYMYLAGEVYPIAENVKGNKYEYDAFEGFTGFDGQRFVQTIVEAVTEGGVAKKVPSVQTPVGKPYATPWAESFADCKTNSIFANVIVKGDDVWKIVASDDYGTSPVDNDGGMMYLEAYGRGACSLLSGKIDLENAIEPAFIFYVYNYLSTSPNDNIIQVEARNINEDYISLLNSPIKELGEGGEWCKVTLPLTDFEGQTIQLRITAYNNVFAFTHLDNFKITSNAQYNLAVSSISAPASVTPNAEFDIKADIENLGFEEARGYNVHLLREGEILDSKSGLKALQSEEVNTVTFNDIATALMVGEHTYSVLVEYGPDMFENDNSKDVVVIVESNSLPSVSDLTATQSAETVSLAWSAPKTNKVNIPSTETFDQVNAWATSINGWTFVDLDKGIIGSIGNKQLPVTGRQSFFVFNNTLPALQTGNVDAFKAHSGTQYLCTMYTQIGGNDVANDDWAISPELSGEPQTISFWASSFPCDPDQPQYYETFQILYSTTGTDTSDFTLIKEYTNIPQQWIEYSAYLPEGAKYFAIRCVSPCQYMLFVDDVTFISKNSLTKTIEVTGYNVYRDGIKLTEEPIAETTFVDKTVDASSSYCYNVTAIYADGESVKSNDAAVDRSQSSIADVNADNIRIYTIQGAVVVEGAAGCEINVNTADGKTIRAIVGESRNVISLSAGLYIVKAGATTAKVVVK